MIFMKGGICSAKGFLASGVHCGLRKNAEQPDLALIYSETPCTAAGVFTKNIVKAAPVLLDIERLSSGEAQAIIVNSGNANACAPGGKENALRMAKAAADALNLSQEKVLVSSTGVIGQPLNIAAIEKSVPDAVASLSAQGSHNAALAIMTTDTIEKEVACQFEINDTIVHLGGIAKGSGMIHPNMGTMLCYITTDCAISAPLLKKALKDAVDVTFNRVSVDGDTSTNDSCIILANGLAQNETIVEFGEEYDVFFDALKEICKQLARKIASDGEGASHLITCTISGASTEKKAEQIAKSIISSSLVKTAVFGGDANWGRIICAMGYSGEEMDPNRIQIAISSYAESLIVCKNGCGIDFDEEQAARIFKEKEILISADIGEGDCYATCWGCDLTYEYVHINGDYRT